ncbi:hypothetical protein M8C21_012167, partial [Ambrosia artemisiifolia]
IYEWKWKRLLLLNKMSHQEIRGDRPGPRDRVIVVGLLCKSFDIKTIKGKATTPGYRGRLPDANYKKRKLSGAAECSVQIEVGVGEGSNGIKGSENDVNSEQVLEKKTEEVTVGGNGVGVGVKVKRMGRPKGSKNKKKRIKDIREMGQCGEDGGKQDQNNVGEGSNGVEGGENNNMSVELVSKTKKRKRRVLDANGVCKGENDQTGATENIIDDHCAVEDQNNAGEGGNGNGKRKFRSTKGVKRKPRLIVAGESGNGNGKRKFRSTKGVKRKPRLIVAGEILPYIEMKSKKPAKNEDPSVPKRPRGRPKKYIDGTRELIPEGGISGDIKTHGESNAGVSNGNKESKMCHQCRLNVYKKVVSCSNCKRRRYCHGCIVSWYPERTKKEVKRACPYCRGNCNCRACLEANATHKEADEDTRLQRSLYLLTKTLPLLKHIREEQKSELMVEAGIRGVELTEEHVPKTSIDVDDRVDNCNTSIVNFHRSCPSPDCSYDICLNCCRELRDGIQPGGAEAESSFQQFLEHSKLQGSEGNTQFFGWKADFKPETFIANNSLDFPIWKANMNGSVPCPPKARGGCGTGMLELKRLYEANWVDELVEKSEALISNFQIASVDFGDKCPLCPNVENFDVVRKAASRMDSNDNFLYCPNAIDLEDKDFDHFQMHWRRGEPVVVKNVEKKTCGLSWEPRVMMRGFRSAQIKLKEENRYVKAIDCLDLCEVEIHLNHFFKGYVEGRRHLNG